MSDDAESGFPLEPPCVGCGKTWPRVTFHNDHDDQILCDQCRSPVGKNPSALTSTTCQ